MAGEDGYRSIVVSELISRAGTNRTRFYEAFADREACFAEAYVAAGDALAGRLTGACTAAEDWATRMWAALVEPARLVAPSRSWRGGSWPSRPGIGARSGKQPRSPLVWIGSTF